MIDILVNYSQPLGFIIWIFFILTMENLGLFLKGLSMKSDFRTNVNWFKKLLENRSKKWNITIVEDENMVINDLISSLKHHYLISGFFWFWPILYSMVAQSSWSSHITLLVICVICVSLLFINDYFRGKTEKKIILSAVKQ